MPSDTQIHPLGDVDTPGDYLIPESAELLLKSAFASFDGTFAAGSFKPLFRIISDAGSIVAEAVADTTIAAGASADASWFPHVAGAAASTPTTFQAPFASLYLTNPATVTNSGLNVYFSMQNGVTGGFETSDSSIFVNAQNTGIAGSPWCIKCLANGTYLVGENYFVRNGTAGALFNTYHVFTGGNTLSFYQPGRTGAKVGDTFDGGSGAVHTFFWELADATTLNPAPMYVNPYANLQSGANVTVSVQTFVRYLGPYAGGII